MIIIGVIAIALFYGLIFRVCRITGLVIMEYNKRVILVNSLLIGLAVIAVYGGVKADHYIYYWDYGREWRTTIHDINIFNDGVVSALKEVYTSINLDDYNKFMPMLMMTPLQLFGKSYLNFVVLHFVLYICPFAIILTKFIIKKINDFEGSTPNEPLILLTVLLTPVIYIVVFDSFMDGPCLLLILSVLMITDSYTYEKVEMEYNLMMVLTMLLMVLFRRQFAYWCVGLIVLLVFNFVFKLKDSYSKKIIYYFIINNSVILLLGIGISILFFRGFLNLSTGTDFKIAYSYYALSYEESIKRHIEVFGYFGMVCGFVVPVIAIFKIKKIRSYLLCNILNIWVTTLYIWSTMSMNYHHYYLIITQVLICGIISFYCLLNRIETVRLRNVFYGLLFGMLILNTVMYSIGIGGNLFTNHYYSAKKRNDVEQIKELVNYLNDISEKQNIKKIYCLAGSSYLNSDMLIVSEEPEKENAISNLMATYNIDLRDGFPVCFFDADLLIVADPIQGDQQVISYLAGLVLDENSCLSDNYSEINRFELDDNIIVKLYLRDKLCDKEDYEIISNYYDAMFPDYPELFYNRIIYPQGIDLKVNESKVLTFDNGLYSGTDSEYSTAGSYIEYGPYLRIEKGVYDVKWLYSYDGNEQDAIGVVDINSENHVFASEECMANATSVEIKSFEINEIVDDIEFRMYALQNGINFEGVVITRTE